MMSRTKLADRILPKYTKGEEIFNMVSHIIGAILGIVATVMCIMLAAFHNNIYGIVGGAIYGITMVILYTMSSIYHGLSPKLLSKKVFQVLDHCSIFLLIAGSYTPFVLVSIREYDSIAAWVIFGIIWFMAILGIVLNAIDIKKFKKFSMMCYIIMGWTIVIKANILPTVLGITGFTLLLSGGITYTIGAILYGIGKKYKYIHSVFHLFILAGSILHFLCIIMYIM